MNKTKKAIIFGTGSFAEIVYFYLTNDSEYEVAAFTEDMQKKDIFFNLPVVSFDSIQEHYSPDEYEFFVAVGYRGINKVRKEIFYKVKEKRYHLLSYVSSKATVWSELIGENCFILEDNTIQPFVKIGNNVILWSGNHIGHHSTIDDHCYITSQVVISGHCHVKESCFIGVNATLRDSLTIERDNVIGAGTVILKNTKEGDVYAMRSTQLFPKKSSELLNI